ncbi:zinc finger protein 292a isoform X1 [Tachysurus ichikawai]
MAEEEAEKEYNRREETVALRKRFQELTTVLRDSADSALDASASFCHGFCQILVEHGGQWKSEEDPLPLLEMYTVAILCFAEATPCLFPECEHVTVVLEKLALTCLDFLLSLSVKVPDALWEEFQSSVKVAHSILQDNGNLQLSTLMALANESGVWTNSTLCHILSNNIPDVEKVHELLAQEGPTLLDMRIKHLIKQKCVEKAAVLAKTCAEFPEFGGKKNFKQIYLVCLCETMSQQELMQEIKEIDCKDALDMICNLESEENEKGALSLCTAFLKRQLLQGDVYCAWELTLFWSKLLIRLESAQAFLDQCRLLAQLSGSVYHILLLIKVIQAEVQNEGLPVCIEMCIQALKIGLSDNEDCNTTICKTISCLLPLDLEVKRACQLTEFLVKPTVDSYYAVETLFNEPDQKLEEESLPIPNSLRCDLLLALKTQWPFDPEFWDWKTLKRHCLALMGEEASIVSSIDKLNDSEENEGLLDADENDFKHLEFTLSSTSDASGIEAERKKKREMKKLREKGFVSARFRNWQAYMQYCVLCDKEFLGHRIVKHALKHVQDGIFRCPICTKTFETRAILEPHVASHVKQSCKERLAAMNANDKKLSSAEPLITNSEKDYSKLAVKVDQTVCTTVVGPSNTNSSTSGNVKPKICSPKRGKPVRDVENTEDCSCPVTSCQKVFKYFRNLVAHVKAHKNEEEATHFLEVQSQKAICQYCRRQFVNMTHLNDHLQMHCGEKPYFCIQLGCKCSFNSHAELLMHRKVHSEFQAQCMFPNCGRVFSEAYLLYDHEAQHYITFTCKSDNCGKIFYTLSQLNLHQKEHVEGVMLQSETEPQKSLNTEQNSNQAADVPQDSSLQNTKQSVDNMLNSTHGTVEEPDHSLSYTSESSVTHDQSLARDPSVAQTNEATTTPNTACVTQSGDESANHVHLRTCYVKLMPIPINYDDSVSSDALSSTDTMTLLSDKKLFCLTCTQITPDLQNETSTNAYVQPLSQKNMENGVENLTHICPFETCTRKYSTSKSLSRHVKNVHIEAFEEWKLSRKYKRIAEIAAKKSDHKLPNIQTSKKRIKSSAKAIPHQFPKIQKVKLQPDDTDVDPIPHLSGPIDSQTFGAKFCPQFEGAPNESPLTETPLMQSQMAQSWTSTSFDGYSSDYSLQNHFPPMGMPDGLQQTCTIEKASALLSGIEVGKFQCDQSKCSAYFTCHLKYIDHIKNDHKAIRVSADGDFESVDLTFKCEYEGCDRVYTTKSNLLRHFIKKHQTTFEGIKQKQKKCDTETESAKTLSTKPNDGKENISSNKIKLKKKNSKKKEEKARNHWTSFGKPSLKSMDEASAMCTRQFPLQYPCMIKGCDSVSSTERNVVKHYTTHGLTERYIENQRSHFIFCKKNSRLRNKEGGKSDDISSDTTELGKADSGENTDPAEKADPQHQVDHMEAVDSIQKTDSLLKADLQQNAEPTQKTDPQQNTEPTQKTDPQQNAELTQKADPLQNADLPQKADPAKSTVNCQGLEREIGAPHKTEQLAFANCTSELIPVKRKRGRPRKSEQTLKMNPERKQSLRHGTTDSNLVPDVSESTSNSAAHYQEQTESGVAQKLFSPLGFKASILKLFEEPPPTNTFKRKSSESDWTDKPIKRKQKNLNVNSIYKNSMFLKKDEDQNTVHFRNPLKLESVNNVKIVMDGSFSNGADLLLKQLQDMRPMVILKKWLCS